MYPIAALGLRLTTRLVRSSRCHRDTGEVGAVAQARASSEHASPSGSEKSAHLMTSVHLYAILVMSSSLGE